ncbi:unnamed protein product [Merluccius merluccius]
MNIMTVRRAVFNVAGQFRRQLVDTASRRALCSKPQETKPEPPASSTAPANRFKLPGYRPSEMDKKMLLWSGRIKTADQIPEFVSFEMIDAARNRMRVKACYVMILTTMLACLGTVILGKRAAGRHESLTGQNMEKKAKWRQDYQLEQEAERAAAMSGKTH